MTRVVLAVLVAVALVAAATPVLLPGLAGAAVAPPQDGAKDADHDGVDDAPFGNDNCAGEDGAYNPTQTDTDYDGQGDACDVDDDADGIDDAVDNCPQNANQSQRDTEGDGEGDPCDLDDDNDGVTDQADNCRFVANAEQRDTDGDSVGDACDPEPTAPSSGRPGTGSPGPGSGGGAGPGPPDEVAPRARLRALQRRVLAADLGGVLPVGLTCSERCTIAAVLRARGRRVGRGKAALEGAGRTYVFVDLDRVALRRARRGRRVRAKLVLSVTDAAGNRVKLRRRVTLMGAL